MTRGHRMGTTLALGIALLVSSGCAGPTSVADREIAAPISATAVAAPSSLPPATVPGPPVSLPVPPPPVSLPVPPPPVSLPAVPPQASQARISPPPSSSPSPALTPTPARTSGTTADKPPAPSTPSADPKATTGPSQPSLPELAHPDVLRQAQYDVANPPSPWVLATGSGDSIGWTPSPGELSVLINPRPLFAAGLDWRRLPAQGWRYQEASTGLHGHHPQPERVIRFEAVPQSLSPSPDAAFDLARLLAARPDEQVHADTVQFRGGDRFSWSPRGLRLELLLTPLAAAGLDKARIDPAAGWHAIPATESRPALLVLEATF